MEDSRGHDLSRSGLGQEGPGSRRVHGTVYSGTGWGLNAIGKVDADGTVHSVTGWSKEGPWDSSNHLTSSSQERPSFCFCAEPPSQLPLRGYQASECRSARPSRTANGCRQGLRATLGYYENRVR
jgi:hypothetical protein